MRVRMRCLGMVMLAAMGCAHTREPYSYLPPLAPPVYPQPQDPQRPAVQPAPLPQSAAGAPVAMLPGPVSGGVVPVGIDPCCEPAACDAAVPVVYESAAAVPCCP